MFDFARRPQLAGANLKRLPAGIIRGNVRRSDPDLSSASPYFPGITPGMTLVAKVDFGAPVTITLTGNTLQGIINDANTALAGAGGIAFDAGGCLGLTTSTAGGTGGIEVTGGSAAAILGFDVALGRVYSTGGDLFGSPEGGLGNRYDVALAGKENLSIEAFNRSLGRVAANADVLFADIMRSNAMMSKVGTLTTSTVVAGQLAYGYVALTAANLGIAADPLVYTGLGLLSRTSSAQDLAPFFVLIDSNTGEPAISKVVALVNGAPSGAPPYSNTASWGAGDGGNILGLDVAKSTTAITAIRGGKLIQATGAGFLTTVRVGDPVEILGATNTSEWSNNGLKWCIESIVDNDNIIVRPLSQAELVMLGVTLTDNQPVVELTSKQSIGEFFGSVRVHTGTFAPGMTLVVSPPIPPSSSIELWCALPGALRTSAAGDRQRSVSPLSRDIVPTSTPVPDLIVSGATQSQVGAVIRTTNATVRWHGRIYKVAGVDLSTTNVTGISADGTYYLYFDSTTGVYKASTAAADVFGPAALGPYLCKATKSGGTLTLVDSSRPLSFSSHRNVITVGDGGDFTSLAAAVSFANTESVSYAETGASLGAYSHFEIVLLDSQTISATVEVKATPGLFIRGANSQIKVSQSGTGYPMFQLTQTQGSFCLEDLIVVPNDNSQPLINLFHTTTCDISLRRVRASQFSDVSCLIYQATGGFAAGNLVIEDCNLETISRCISASAASVFIDNSILNCQYISDVNTQMFSGSGGVAWDGGNITCLRSSFGTYGNPNDFVGGVVHDTGSTNIHVFEDCRFPDWQFEGQHSTLWTTACETHILRCEVDTSLAVANLTHTKSTVDFCDFTGAPTDALITCPIVRYNRVTCLDPFGIATPNAGVICNVAVGNIISGTASWAIDASGTLTGFSGSKVHGNIINMTKGLQSGANGIRVWASLSVVTENIVSLGTNYTASSFAIQFTGGTSFSTVSHNILNIGQNSQGITLANGQTGATVVGNLVHSTSGVAVLGINLLSVTQANVQGNWVTLGSSDSASAALSLNNASECDISGNLLSSTGGTSLCVSSTTGSNMIWSSNILKGQVGTSGSPVQSRFVCNRVSGAAFVKGTTGTTAVSVSTNRFEGGVTLTLDAGVTMDFCDNLVIGNTSIPSGVQGSNNFISGNLTFSAANTSTWVGGIVTGVFNSGTGSVQLQVMGTTLSGTGKSHVISGAIAVGIWVDPSSTTTLTAAARISSSDLGIVAGGGFRITDCLVASSTTISVADATNPTVIDHVDAPDGANGVLLAVTMTGRALIVNKCRFMGKSLGLTASVDFTATETLEVSDTWFGGGGTVSIQNKPTYADFETKSSTIVRGNRVTGSDLKVISTAAVLKCDDNEVGSDTAASGSTITGNLTVGYDPGGGLVSTKSRAWVRGNTLRFGGVLSVTGNEAALGATNVAGGLFGTIAWIEDNVSMVEKDNSTHTLSGAPKMILKGLGRGAIRGNVFTFDGSTLSSTPDQPVLSMDTCSYMTLEGNYFLRSVNTPATSMVELVASSRNLFGPNSFYDTTGSSAIKLDATSYGNTLQGDTLPAKYNRVGGAGITDSNAGVGTDVTWFTPLPTNVNPF